MPGREKLVRNARSCNVLQLPRDATQKPFPPCSTSARHRPGASAGGDEKRTNISYVKKENSVYPKDKKKEKKKSHEGATSFES